jgi:hypothetical protein
VSYARLLLVALICASPAIVVFDGPIARALVAGVTAIGLFILLRTMRPGETSFFLSTTRTVAYVAVIPAIWMLIQVIPLGVLINPVWNSAATAMGRPLSGAISIDIGAGVIALGQYITLIAISLLSAAVAIDRQRAEWTLFSLMAATTVVALGVIVSQLFDPKRASDWGTSLPHTQALDCAALGVIFAGAIALRTLERYETRRASRDRSVPLLMVSFACSAMALLICAVALALNAQISVLVATAYGIAALGAVVFIRRLGLGPWGIVAVVLPGVALAAFLIAGNPTLGTKSFYLIFGSHVSDALTSTSQRILTDTPLWGTGAGGFSAIAPIYSDINEVTSQSAGAPTAAAAAAIELGTPLLWFIAGATISAIVVLFRASLQRGRDSFYANAGAACLLVLLLLGFINAGLLGMGIAMIAAVTVGLAFAQSRSRSVQPASNR